MMTAEDRKRRYAAHMLQMAQHFLDRAAKMSPDVDVREQISTVKTSVADVQAKQAAVMPIKPVKVG